MCSCPCSKTIWKEKPCSRKLAPSSCSANACSDQHVHTIEGDTCQSLEKQGNSHAVESASAHLVVPSNLTDIESGPAVAEHVVLQFRGSNCPGCTSKITKALESKPFIHNLRMDSIQQQAEFDTDTTKTSTQDLIQRVQRSTGLKCERIRHGMQELEVLISEISTDIQDAPLPAGVTDVTYLKHNTFSVKYDAKTIGARQLLRALHTHLGGAVTLAPSRSNDAIPTNIRNVVCMTMISWVLTISLLILAWAPLPPHPITYGAVSLALATVIQIVIAGPYYPRAFRDLLVARVIGMDLLIVLSTSITYCVSVAAFVCEVERKKLATAVYFETSALLITLIMTGRLLSDLACHRAIKSRSAKPLQPQNATLVDSLDPADGKNEEFDIRLLQYDDVFRVKAGDVIVTDGIIVCGVSEVDESIITGEAKPVEKTVGSSVIAGSLNHEGTLLVKVTRVPGENTIDEIAGMVEEVTQSKPRIQHIADQVAKWIAPTIGTLAMLTLAIWFTIGVSVRKQSAGSAILSALPYAVSVLVVSCPCAIGLAVPMVLIVAGGVGAKYGLMFKSAEVMRRMRGVTHVIFDKTGTLTESAMSVVSEEYCSDSRSAIAGFVLALTRESDHPVSSAVAKHLKAESFEPSEVTDVKPIVGKGVEGIYNGVVIRVGNARWLEMETKPIVQSLLSKDLTVFCISMNGKLVGAFGLAATLRRDAKEVVTRLNERGICVAILSGDESGAVQKVAKELCISPKNVRSQCTPLEKQQYVRKAMHTGSTVLFCGDGINDAAALAQADIGLHISDGSPMMCSAGDAVLTRPSLSGILILRDLSCDAWRLVIFNFAWAACYNVVAILFAAGAFVTVRLPPEYAGLGEAVSVLPVILVPMLLRWKKYQ